MTDLPAEPERIHKLNDAEPDPRGGYVLYWMQASQRARHNPALETALALANEAKLPCLVVFGLTDAYPEANERHYAFLLEGLAETAATLKQRGIGFVLRHSSPDDAALSLAGEARLVVCDVGYLRHQKDWRRNVARKAGRQVIAVEADVVVPVETASTKAETAARTLRPRIGRHVERFLVDLPALDAKRDGTGLKRSGDLDPAAPEKALAALDIDRSIARSTRFTGGTGEALRLLETFLDDAAHDYADKRSDPSRDKGSHMSPYLHFGQISPVEIARAVEGREGVARASKDSYLEELIVRRELAMNFVHHRPDDYDRFAAMPEWARNTLEQHSDDAREHTHDIRTLRAARTGDRYWDAAMREMLATGYMHNYMRMYWGKQVIAWYASPKSAYETLLTLNNAYFLDGRDPNSYANVGWIFGLHDRGWPERAVFGKVRSMTAGGLKRKFDIDAYCRWAESLPI